MATMIIRRFIHPFSTQARCMILHPVSFPNKGAVIEQYLAEQAVGLAKSLGWLIVKGPYWNSNNPEYITPRSIKSKKNHLYIESDGSEIKDGDYVRTNLGKGMVEGDGIVFDDNESESEGDLFKQWRNKLLRESLANSSLIKCRRITKKTFFTPGKLEFIADYVKDNQVDCVYVNAELKPTQVKNLKKVIEARLNDISIRSAYKAFSQAESQTEFETEENSELIARRQRSDFKKIRIFDRFSIILQIFAQRSTTKLAKLQIELSYLTYLKTRLVREGAVYSSTLNMFFGDLMKAEQVNMEIVSAKQRRAARTMSGGGQSQLEIQRRNIRDKEANIRREIEEQGRLRHISMDKLKKRNTTIPVVALVGYTNVGKSAFMNNLMKKNEVQSKDMLFQTLHTTSRHITTPSGTKMILLDTIGFITNLPVEMVEAFKTTLQQISHADLVIHLRDISHPQQQLQKQSVIKILKELNFQPSFYTERMIDVWNKIDLVTAEDIDNVQDAQARKVSCLTGEGMKDLFVAIEEKLKVLSNSKNYIVQYGIEHHEAVIKWLRTNTNTSFNLNAQYNYDSTRQHPSGSVKLSLDLDQASYGKLQRFLNPEGKSKSRASKGMPPKEGW